MNVFSKYYGVIKTVLSCVFLFLHSFVFTQQYDLDSLQSARLKLDPDGFEYWSTTCDMANYYVYHDLKKAQTMIDSVLTQFKLAPTASQIPKCYHRHFLIKAWTHHGNNQLEDAIYYMRKVDSIASHSKLCYDRDNEIEIQINLSTLLVAHQDTTAMRYVEGVLAKVDTSLSLDENIAWVMCKMNKGAIYEKQGYYRLAFNEYHEVSQSGVLDKIPNYRIGIIKGLSRIATLVRDHHYANETLLNLASDTSLYAYELNDIQYGLATQYYQMDSLQQAEERLEMILGSRNLNSDILFESYLLLARIQALKENHLELGETFKVLDSLGLTIQNAEYKRTLQLVKAKYYCSRNNKNLCNQLVNPLLKEDQLMFPQKIECQKLWLINNLDNSSRDRFIAYQSDYSNYMDRKSDNTIQELIVEHGVEKQRLKNNSLEREIDSLSEVNLQKGRIIRCLGVSALLAMLLLFYVRKSAVVTKKYNLLLEAEKNKLANDNETLAFEKNELVLINKNLEAYINEVKNKAVPVEKLEIKSLDKIHMVDLRDIIYCKSEAEGVRIFLKGSKSIWSGIRLKEFKEKLPQSNFLRIFRSTIINVYHLEWVNHATLKMVNGDELKIGRTYKDDLQKLLE